VINTSASLLLAYHFKSWSHVSEETLGKPYTDPNTHKKTDNAELIKERPYRVQAYAKAMQSVQETVQELTFDTLHSHNYEQDHFLEGCGRSSMTNVTDIGHVAG
jgi:hypothetical protein